MTGCDSDLFKIISDFHVYRNNTLRGKWLKETKRNRIFFGWWTVITASLFFSLAAGYGMQGASIIFKPLSHDLDLSRAVTSIAIGIASLQAGIVWPLAGWLSDKYGSKWLTVTACCITGAGLVFMNFIHSAWTYYLAWGMIAVGNSLGFSISIDKVVTNWFVKRRGLAFSIRFVIAAVVGIALFPVVSILVSSFGWRTSALIWSLVVFATIPVALIFIRDKRPEHYGLLPDGAKINPGLENERTVTAQGLEYAASVEEQEFTLTQALKTPAYWMLTAAWTIYNILYQGINVHIVPMLTDTGINPVEAASLMSLMTFFSLPSRFSSGIVADRMSKDKIKYLMAGTLLLIALGIWALNLNPGFKGRIYLFLALFGLGSGAFIPVDIMIRSRYYGRKAYGAIQSASVIFSAPISFFAPIYAGWVYDTHGSYAPAFLTFALLATCGVVIVALIRVPKIVTGESISGKAVKKLESINGNIRKTGNP